MQLVSNFADQSIARRVSAGIVDVFELIEVNKKQRTGFVPLHDIQYLCTQDLDKATAIVKAGQAVVIRKILQLRIAFAQGGRSRFQRFDDIGYFAMLRGFKLDVQIALRQLLNRQLQIGKRCQRLAQCVTTVDGKYDQQCQQYNNGQANIGQQAIMENDKIELHADEAQQFHT